MSKNSIHCLVAATWKRKCASPTWNDQLWWFSISRIVIILEIAQIFHPKRIISLFSYIVTCLNWAVFVEFYVSSKMEPNPTTGHGSEQKEMPIAISQYANIQSHTNSFIHCWAEQSWTTLLYHAIHFQLTALLYSHNLHYPQSYHFFKQVWVYNDFCCGLWEYQKLHILIINNQCYKSLHPIMYCLVYLAWLKSLKASPIHKCFSIFPTSIDLNSAETGVQGRPTVPSRISPSASDQQAKDGCPC